MRFAISIPNIGGEFADPHFATELAREAEESGWDGFFVWDHIGADWDWPVSDPRIVLGPMVTPLLRRRPWKVAREAVTLDHLSRGRLRLGVGIGTDSENEYSCYGEPADDKLHAAMLDEGLEVLEGLWGGRPFDYAGVHYQLNGAHYLPMPVQRPRIPIWVAGVWPNRRPFRRAVRWDGVVPLGKDGPLRPGDYRDMLAYVGEHRTSADRFDVTVGRQTSGDDPAEDAESAAAYAEAGVTWWIEELNNWRGRIEGQRKRVHSGPPRA